MFAATAQVAFAKERLPTKEVTIVSVAPSGLKNHVHDWVAVVRIRQTAKESAATARLFMHSPVLKFGIAADELPGRSFRIAIGEQRGNSIFKFDIVEER